MILSICDVPSVLKVMKVVKIVITLIRIIVPIMLIVSVMIDFVRAVTNAKLNKITKPMINKIIAAILVFFIPTFVRLISNISGTSIKYEKCLGDITSETIEMAYEEKAEKLVRKVEETFDKNDYDNALAYLTNVKNSDKKEAFIKRLEAVKNKNDKGKDDNTKKNNINYFIYLGDSRTYAYNNNASYLGINSQYEKIIARNGTKYDSYFKSHLESAKNFLSLVNNSYNVTVNYGVNNLSKKVEFCNDYVSFAKNMNSKHNFYIVSVNPVNDNISRYAKNNSIEKFNDYMKNTCVNRIKTETNKNVYYCDVYNKISLDDWMKYVDSSGIHYTKEGYKFIYNSIKDCTK